jgi:hypothetical protein
MAVQYAFGQIVTSGLVLALNAADRNSYPGSGTAWSDLSGNNNTGTLTNGPTFSTGSGGSIVLDGTNDFVNISGGNGLLSGLSTATMDMWINITRKTGGGEQFQYVGGWRNDTNTDFFFLLLDNSGATVNTEARARTSSGFYDINVNFTPYFGVWTNVSFVVNTNRTDLYINGTSVGSNTNKLGSFSISNLKIGENAIGVSGVYATRGNVANFTIYNRALTASEVAQNYDVQKSRFGL